MTRFLARAAAAVATVLGLVGVAAAPAAAAPTTGNQSLSAHIVVLGCNSAGGGDIDTWFRNRTHAERAVVITVYRGSESQPVFEGDEAAVPGTSVLPYRGLPPALYRLVVRSGGHVLDSARADFRQCPALPEPPPPLSQQLAQQSARLIQQ